MRIKNKQSSRGKIRVHFIIQTKYIHVFEDYKCIVYACISNRNVLTYLTFEDAKLNNISVLE